LAKPGSDLNKEGCATVLTKIKFSRLNVSEKVFKEKVFFGHRSIRVRGNVELKLLAAWKG
jgi:hypothetical protein